LVVIESHSNSSRIDGWKSIARYLGRDRATVMRWEAARGLPVHRLPGGGRARVFAIGSELDAWLSGASDIHLDAIDGEGLQSTIGRRQLVIATVTTVAVGAFSLNYLRRTKNDPEVTALLEQARVLRSQNTLETQNQAIGLASEAVRLAPHDAVAWGVLGHVRGAASRWRNETQSRRLRDLAIMDGQRSLDLLPGNAKGELALATALPLMGRDNWLSRSNGLKRALSGDPTDPDALIEQAWILRFTGHCREAKDVCERVAPRFRTAPFYNIWARASWGAGLLEETDRILAKAASLYPTNKMLWHTRVEVLMLGGRPNQAIAMAGHQDGRPTVVTNSEVDELVAMARAVSAQDASQVDQILLRLRASALKSIRPAVNAIRIASICERLDDAFAFADAYFFGRGFTVSGDVGGGLFISESQRHTNFLFEPPAAAMWGDQRFGILLEQLGLEKYWRESRKPPDFRKYQTGRSV